jgi:DNA-binding transcriptional LysR family regulator
MPETKEAFLAARYIVFSDELPMHEAWWRASFGKRAPLPKSIVCRIASLDEMLALAEAGLGITVLPSYFIEESLAKKRLLVLWPPKARPGAVPRTAENTLHLVWRKGTIETARFRLVRDAILAGALR